jgi:hypothetical protein
MKYLHHIRFNSLEERELFSIIQKKGIRYKAFDLPGKGQLITIEIDESDSRWEQLSSLVMRGKVLDFQQTLFSKDEIYKAEWLRLIPVFARQYPQPEKTWVSNPINYDDHCPKCGIYHQKDSFRIKKEPLMGKNDFMTLNWTYELFSTSKVLDELTIRKIQDFQPWDVIINRTGLPSGVIHQLYIPNVTGPGLGNLHKQMGTVCPVCSIRKYPFHTRGVMYYQRDALVPNIEILRTNEWFGSLHFAFREILVSNRVAKLILENGWHGVEFKVIQLID